MMGGARLTTIADTTLVPLYSGVHDVVVSDMGDDVACQVTFCNPYLQCRHVVLLTTCAYSCFS